GVSAYRHAAAGRGYAAGVQPRAVEPARPGGVHGRRQVALAVVSAPRFTLLLAIARGVRLLLHVPALMVLVTMPLCLSFGESRGFAALAWAAVVAVGGGQALYWPARRHVPTHPREAMLIAALAWLGVSGVAALPFVLGFGTSALDALFESLSGFTGTGLSV